MIPVLSRTRQRALDEHAISSGSVPSLALMENAGRGAAELIAQWLGARLPGARVVVVCGSGNNGGDGFVVARRLRVAGADARVYLAAAPDRLTADAGANHAAWLGVGGVLLPGLPELRAELAGCDLVVDALLGTGLDREVTGPLRELIELINVAPAPCVALDVPSGLHADRGVPLGVAVRAVATVTFGHHKLGLLCTQGAVHAGRVYVVDIGLPAGLCAAAGCDAWLLESADVAALSPRRSLDAHKGSAGRVLAICGAPGKIGAALLVGQGALRAGAGLVTVATFPEAAAALDQRVLEIMTTRIDPERAVESLCEPLGRTDTVVLGPGFGTDERARRVVDHVVLGWDGVKILDADAITLFGGRAEELRRAPGTCLLTPHPGEAARLLATTAAAVEADRFGALARLVELTGGVVLLKGPRTLVGAPGELPVVIAVDCPALATGGAGDVLSGVCGALACRLPLRPAAFCAAFLHARSAAAWSSRTGADRGLLAHEVADGIPEALAALAAPPGPMPV